MSLYVFLILALTEKIFLLNLGSTCPTNWKRLSWAVKIQKEKCAYGLWWFSSLYFHPLSKSFSLCKSFLMLLLVRLKWRWRRVSPFSVSSIATSFLLLFCLIHIVFSFFASEPIQPWHFPGTPEHIFCLSLSLPPFFLFSPTLHFDDQKMHGSF